MKKIIVSISWAILLCACGNSQGSGAPALVATSASVSVNPISKDGNVLVGATLLGGLVGTGVVSLSKSNSEGAGDESVQVALAKIIFQDVLKKSVNEFDHVPIGKSIGVPMGGDGKIEYEKEAFSVYGGYVIITGSVDYVAPESTNHVSIKGHFTADFMNVSFPVVYDGKSNLETITGSIATTMSASILYSLDSQGKLSKTYATLDFKFRSGSLKVTGDVGGRAENLSIEYSTTADLVSGTAISGPVCSGEVTVVTEKFIEICDVRQSCDGCSASSTVDAL